MNPVSSAAAPAHALDVALLQFNPIVGDLKGNARSIVEASRQAYANGARLVVTPEMALCGYPAEDLLLRPAFMQACDDAVQEIAQALADLPDLHLVLGHPLKGDGEDIRERSWSVLKRFNAATLIRGGQCIASYAKRELPNYQVFDERRYFISGREAGLGPVVVDVLGWRVGLLVRRTRAIRRYPRRERAGGVERIALPRRQAGRTRNAHGRPRTLAGRAAGLCPHGGRAGRGGVRRGLLRG
jgi:NAD+ synthase (glutamine-hydrolysing)